MANARLAPISGPAAEGGDEKRNVGLRTSLLVFNRVRWCRFLSHLLLPSPASRAGSTSALRQAVLCDPTEEEREHGAGVHWVTSRDLKRTSRRSPETGKM